MHTATTAFKSCQLGVLLFDESETMSKVTGVAALAFALAACGGGGGDDTSNSGQPAVASDPLATLAWHLKNTGPGQTVSAIANSQALAGIDANVASVHQEGAGITGKGVTIAVVDSGLEIGHEDLRANVLAEKSFNFETKETDPSPPASRPLLEEADHGTGVAGVAAAKGWNNLGSRGLAPNASLVGYAPLERLVGVNEILSFGGAGSLVGNAGASVDALVKKFGSRADGVDIFNLSAGDEFASPQQDPTAPDSMTLASEYGTQKLRGGKGAVYLQAAGNGFIFSSDAKLRDERTLELDCAEVFEKDGILARFSNGAAGHSCLNSNFETHGQPYFMKVAAIANSGKASSYSSAGAVNWVTGFGGEYGIDTAAIVSTDDSGCKLGANSAASRLELKARLPETLFSQINKLLANLFGRSTDDPNCNYTGTMNGTSAATPSVSGVVALILEANPALTWLDVKYILAKTARKVDSGIALGAQAVTYLPQGAAQPLRLSDPWATNQAGFNFQARYGFGLVDAAAAVAMAKSYTKPTGRRVAPLITKAQEGYRAFNFPTLSGRVAVVEQDSTFSGGVSGPFQVDLTLNNTTGRTINPGTLQFELRNAATGQRSILMPAYTAWYEGGKIDTIAAKGKQKFRFFSNAFYGEPLAGTWTLRVLLIDGAPNESATFDATTLANLTLTSHEI